MSKTVIELRQPHSRSPGTRVREVLKIVIVGHVDHGKSTLIGRLLYDTHSLPPEQIAAIEAVSAKRGKGIEWAFLLDAFQAERDQGITIDSSQIRFASDKRDYVIIDAPGHREFVTNMISGAASADAALLVVDAGEGVRQQTRRHGYLLRMLGIRQVAVIINKMDQVGYAEQRFLELERDINGYLDSLGIAASFIVPVSAYNGHNIITPAAEMAWYDGVSVVEALDAFTQRPAPAHLPLRVPIQDVYKFDDRRILVGRVESGVLRVGDTLLFSPSNKTSVVRSLETWHDDVPPVEASAGQVVGFTLEEQIFVERGEMASDLEAPPFETNVARAHIFWLGRAPLEEGKRYVMKQATACHDVVVESIETLIDTDTLKSSAGTQVERHGIAEVVLRSRSMLAVDEYRTNPSLGRFLLLDGYDIVGGGLLRLEGYPDQRQSVTVKATNIHPVDHKITATMRAQQTGHKGGVLWFTGLSGAGKSTLALELERQLYRRGYHVYVLDGDNVRSGLNANLGFSPEDRGENIRRVGELAALFADAGLIVITAFISPYQADRDRARGAAGKVFHEVYIKSDLATCEKRDPKGLYQKARRGEIADFTGISAPYEQPQAAEMVVDTSTLDEDECVAQLMNYVSKKFKLRNGARG